MDVDKTVLVAVRSRPLLSREDDIYNPGLVFSDTEVSIQDKRFSFDYVFPPGSSNSQVYNTAVESRLHRIFEGYNLTIFAYGQTGSGKTYTMGTNYPPVLQNESGIILLSVTRIFQDIKQREHEYEFTVNISFLEVYKEDVYDLLCKGKKSSSCQIREDFDGIKVVNVTEAPVTSVEEVLSILEQGCQGRSTAATAMNEHSSRSHSLFILTIEQRNKTNFETKKSKFQLVDLAGSERADQSKTEGLRFKEGIDINRGLLALGKVIAALSDGKSHIPYRDSRLTRLLMDSLGGNSYTLMIACVSPSASNSDETISTLRYASRARKIKNKPVINNDPPDVQIQKLKQQVELLQAQVYRKSSNLENVSGLEEFSELREQNENLKKEVNKCLGRIARLTEQLTKEEENMGIVKEKVNKLYQQIQTCVAKYDGNNNSSIPVDELFGLVKNIEEEFKDLVSNYQLLRYIKEDNFSKVPYTTDIASIPSGSEGSDGDESSQELDAEQIGRKLEFVELQLLKKQEIAEHFEVLSQVIDDSSTENLNSLQEKIDVLLKERSELEVALKNSEKMLLEERNKRYKECQSEIKTLEKELLRSKLLNKFKEENKRKVETLQREIQNLKSTRVKLVKKMKEESDNFRKMQIAKDREVEKLKKNERKKDFAMFKLQNDFNKQVNAFKQKIEKYQSANKRLNEALSRQKFPQIILKNKKIPKENMESWLNKEIEIESLKRLVSSEYIAAKENIGHLTEEARNIQKGNTNNSSHLILLGLEAEKLEQQKPVQDATAQGETNVDRWSTLSSMTDAKTALTVLFNKCIEDCVKLNSGTGLGSPSKQKELENKMKECEDKYNDLLAQNRSLKEKMKKYSQSFQKEKSEHNARVIHDLKVINDIEKSCARIQSDETLLEKLQAQEMVIENLKQCFEENSKLKDEIEYWKSEYRNKIKAKRARYLSSDIRGLQTNSTSDACADNIDSMMMQYLDEDLGDDSFQNMDDDKDPDWRLTPLHKQRKRTLNVLKEQNNGSVSEITEDTDQPAKRSFSGCDCPGDCRTMRCACKKKMKSCDFSCGCNRNTCVNIQ